MKISRKWLQRYFEKELPDAATLAEALTFHAFEIESVENDILDVKVTPNRGHDCLCHRGIAKELSAILQMPMKSDPLRQAVQLQPKCSDISVHIEDADLCPRFTVAYITGIKVGPSPDWLRHHLESVGQKSINNVVDATNFVMFDLGQPLHAFDTGKLLKKDSKYSLIIRTAKKGETLVGLDEKKYELTDSMLAIVDENAGIVASIAGIKGGKQTGIDETTTSIILEGANWDGVNIRKTSHALKLRTDASSRFEQVISPELAAFGVSTCAKLIQEIAGGEVVGFVDEYPVKQQQKSVSTSAGQINSILGSQLTDTEIADTLTRLDLPFAKQGHMFVVEPPFERLDLLIPEDIAEEVGRTIGYDKIPATPLPPMSGKPEINQNFYAAERVREEYVAKGYSEVFTSVFADKGERVVANKVDGVRPFLRTTLVDGLRDALAKNRLNKDLLGLEDVKLFEIGAVWKGAAQRALPGGSCEEKTMLGVADAEGVREEPLSTMYRGDASIQYENLPLSTAQRFQPFSKYPFIVRDIALWIPGELEAGDVEKTIRGSAGLLLQRLDLFDTFKRDDKTSLAFRLVFQSFDHTLTDLDANQRMESVYQAVQKKGWEVR